MYELCSFKCLKLYWLNFAIAHAPIKIVMLFKTGLNCAAYIHKKTAESLETSSEIVLEFSKFVKS